MAELKPCPFCGGKPTVVKYDRGISIGCIRCKYQRLFDGVLSTEPSPILASAPESFVKEYYHADAGERAIEAWNRRVDNG